MKRRVPYLKLALIVLLTGIIAGVFRFGHRPAQSTLKNEGFTLVSVAASNSLPAISGAGWTPENRADAALQTAAADLASAIDPTGKRKALSRMREALDSSSTNEASKAILRFLDSKADATTGLEFSVGARGVLAQAPTLRVALLDYLGQIDPAAAASYARNILSRAESADEWSVALRNLAWGDPSAAGRTFLQQKMAEMLSDVSWQINPSTGYLEAFDVAVYLGGTLLVEPLTDLVRKQDNPAAAHAAFLALDRLVINNPAPMLETLQANPEAMQGREATRADFFARADVRDPQQRQVLESYLLNPGLAPAELAHFAGIYPNANYMISQNLLTPTPTPDPSALILRDRESLRVIDDWIADPRFAGVRSQLEQSRARLETFVKQAAAR
jgi:hypothetical protein